MPARHLTCVVFLAAGLIACAPAARSVPTATLPRVAATPAPTAFVLATHPLRLVTPAVSPTPIPTSTSTPVDAGPLPRLRAESVSWISPIDGMTLIGIPEGEFWMGSATDDVYAEPDEMPLRRVFLDGYWIDQTEVTNAMFAECVRAGACTSPPSAFGPFSPHPYYGADDFAVYPVVNVTWHQAQAYCTWAGRRLPTEAEWEKAARGTDARRFPWEWIGVADPEKLNFCDQDCAFPWHVPDVKDGYAETAPVGSYPKGASPYQVLDMAGNVWEWAADWYGALTYREPPLRNPVGPEGGTWRVVRGGSWLDGVHVRTLVYARSANRHYQSPDTARSDIGFRCVLPAP
ncbi:MAG: formylglycine-generating enzyme family protein [Anaerolineales bacterium]|nr:formylglycine-generating enzyme family protein [Anaerolineales bacterium]